MGNPKWIQIYGAGLDANVFHCGRPALPLSSDVVVSIEANPSTNIARLYNGQRQIIAAFSGLPFIAVY